MYRIKFTILLLLISTIGIKAQSIRKNHLEMTKSEKDALVDAFTKLKDGLVNDLANFHNSNFGNIHFNLPSSPDKDAFFAWHRRQIFELEQAMQEINPDISIPFWNWVTDNSTASILWDNDFMGQFDVDWLLNRNLGGRGNLPSQSQVDAVQAETDWLTYSNNMERTTPHTGAHMWVGGTMSGGSSPRDPIFYLHHGMVDKLWQDWVEANGITPSSNIYELPLLPRYDGTYVFDGKTLPEVNPDDIVDSKALGVFFAEDKLAELEDYTVSNTYKSQENFYYQYIIEAKNNFVIPSGKKAKLESVTKVILKPGFSAKEGSHFIAKIDEDNTILTKARLVSRKTYKNIKPFDDIKIKENAYELDFSSENKEVKVTLYPNPASNFLKFEFKNSCNQCEVEILNLLGESVLRSKLDEGSKTEIDISHLNSSVYFIGIIKNKEILFSKKLIKL